MVEMGEREQSLNQTINTHELTDQSTETVELRTIYYGVYIPPDVEVQEPDVCSVFLDKEEALKLVKKYKKARFKAFELVENAIEFAENGSECHNKSQEGQVGEKSSPFRGPTSQNLVKFRKSIESGDVAAVHQTIWDNPRYLIGSGDTPSILQEGFRYNALHVAAKAKNAAMCNLILNTISDLMFITKLYVDDGNPEDRSQMLLDLYLNTPDKGHNETPLHFAVKFGSPQCVEVFTSYLQCDKHLRNKHGSLPKDIICDRYNGPDAKLVSEQIALLLDDNYYVPVLRAEDNCVPPTIGEPFSPTSPPNINRDPLSPRMEIHAYAGPMNKEGADKFRKLWKTPPRLLTFGRQSQPASNIATLKFKDHEKGLERMGNNLANQLDVEWKEYWPFLDSFVDLASEEGLQLFEKYLREKLSARYTCSSTLSHTPPNNSPSPPLIWAEDLLVPDRGPRRRSNEHSPMSELCRALEACVIKDSSSNSPISKSRIAQYSPHSIQLANGKEGDDWALHMHESPLNPLLCIEKSLQVFAKRIANDIIFLLEADCDTCTLIESQVRQLHALMASYRDDQRFRSVNISVVHCRLAHLIKQQLEMNLENMRLNNVLNRIDAWLNFSSNNWDRFSSDDEAGQASIAPTKSLHACCLLKNLRNILHNDSILNVDISSEETCTNTWKLMTPCQCKWDKKMAKKFNGIKRAKTKFATMIKKDPTRKLLFDDIQSGDDAFEHCVHFRDSESLENSDNEYYTPPLSPSCLQIEDDDVEDEFYDTYLKDIQLFIEGDEPTKVDNSAFNALKYAERVIDSEIFPNIYRWQHAVSLFNENERKSWTSPSVAQFPTTDITSTPIRSSNLNRSSKDAQVAFSPPSSSLWMRVTGANSPRTSFPLKRNMSFNL